MMDILALALVAAVAAGLWLVVLWLAVMAAYSIIERHDSYRRKRDDEAKARR